MPIYHFTEEQLQEAVDTWLGELREVGEQEQKIIAAGYHLYTFFKSEQARNQLLDDQQINLG